MVARDATSKVALGGSLVVLVGPLRTVVSVVVDGDLAGGSRIGWIILIMMGSFVELIP